MAHKIFVNLPVRDLDRSMAFFRALGFDFNAQFTDATAACMVVSPDIYVMLLTHAKFAEFSPKPIVDTSKALEALTCLSVDAREDVGRMVEAAIKAGAGEPLPPRDYGFMIQRCFTDPDGHVWEIVWMDPAQIAG